MINQCGFIWVATSDSSTKDMFTLISNISMHWHDLHFAGSVAHPVRSFLGLTTDDTSIGGQQFNTYERLTMGPYPTGDQTSGATYGIYVYGANANNDFENWTDVNISSTLDSCLNNSTNQSVLWIMTHTTFTNCTVGIKTGAGPMTLNSAFFGNNTWDIETIKSADGNISAPEIILNQGGSEGSQGFINFAGSGGYSAVSNVLIHQFQWSYANGVTPTDQGPCGPGTGAYAHCHTIIYANSVPVKMKGDFCILSHASPGMPIPIMDFSQSASPASWAVDMDLESDENCGDLTPNFLIGSTQTPSGNIQRFHYKNLGNLSDHTPTEWNYELGLNTGNLYSFVPASGTLIMDRARLNGTQGAQTCAGTSCTMDITKGLVQVFNITGNVTGWTVLPDATTGPGFLPNNGLGRISVWICSSGGDFTAVAPVFPFATPVKNWGFGATIANGKCAHQDIEATGFHGPSTPMTTDYYGVGFENGITP